MIRTDGPMNLSALALQGDRIVASGTVDRGSGRFVVARMRPGGALDVTFSGDGVVTTGFGPDRTIVADMTVGSDGIVVAGFNAAAGGAASDAVVARYSANGALDPGFDGDGIVRLTVPGQRTYGRGLALDARGRLLVTAVTYAPYEGDPADAAVFRLRGGGRLDTTFSSDGIAKPATDLLPVRVVVVHAGPVADVLAEYDGQAGHGRLLGCAIEIARIDLFDRQVQVPALSDRSSQVGEHERPLFRGHVFHRIDAHRAVEPAVERELLLADVLKPHLGVFRPRSLEHPR